MTGAGRRRGALLLLAGWGALGGGAGCADSCVRPRASLVPVRFLAHDTSRTPAWCVPTGVRFPADGEGPGLVLYRVAAPWRWHGATRVPAGALVAATARSTDGGAVLVLALLRLPGSAVWTPVQGVLDPRSGEAYFSALTLPEGAGWRPEEPGGPAGGAADQGKSGP